MHKLAVKNAASALTWIVKRNEAAMARCRELRGKEMIVALGKVGMFDLEFRSHCSVPPEFIRKSNAGYDSTCCLHSSPSGGKTSTLD